VTQARDVFDLAILFRGGHGPPEAGSKLIANAVYSKAIDCLMGLTWEDYQGQVVEFLDEDQRGDYGDKPAWERLQNQVLSQLDANA